KHGELVELESPSRDRPLFRFLWNPPPPIDQETSASALLACRVDPDHAAPRYLHHHSSRTSRHRRASEHLGLHPAHRDWSHARFRLFAAARPDLAFSRP